MGVLEGKGSGSEPSCYTECIETTVYATDRVMSELDCDLTLDHYVSENEPVSHVDKSESLPGVTLTFECLCTATSNKTDAFEVKEPVEPACLEPEKSGSKAPETLIVLYEGSKESNPVPLVSAYETCEEAVNCE